MNTLHVFRQLREGVSTGTVEGKTVYLSPKCRECGRTLAEYLAPPYSLRCHRCKASNVLAKIESFNPHPA